MRYYFRKLVKEPLPWPQVKRINILELIGGIGFGAIFLTPFIYGQYSYKTRTGLSGVNFSRLSTTEDIFDPSASKETTTNFLTDILQSDIKPGDHY